MNPELKKEEYRINTSSIRQCTEKNIEAIGKRIEYEYLKDKYNVDSKMKARKQVMKND